jgi:Reverse transcriptase (RNA-dependent DNA polymerase)./Integrase core domain.
MLNKALKRKIYPLPKIQEILQRRKGYKYFTKLDLSMQYYAFELDEESSELCVIVTPFGKYKYKRLPMGICLSTVIAQEIMEEVLRDIENVEIYLDDIGIFSDDWNSHLKTIQLVLMKLEENGFSINPLKCEWAVQETDWLGYWLTPEGLKPWTKKIKAIQAIQEPTNLRQLRSFIGMINHYKEMWPHRSHIMSPLTSLTGHKFQWNDACQKAFEHIKLMITEDVLLAYPDHNLPFEIQTDASDYQLGSVIKQKGRPVAYFSKKLNKAQKNYTIEEKEILSIVETLKTFRSMLLGAQIHIFTDHLNLTYHKFTTQRVLRQRLYIEEFNPQFHHIPGRHNKIADALSRLPIKDEQQIQQMNNECYINSPPLQELQYPLNYNDIAQQQIEDQLLLQAMQCNPTRFRVKNIKNVDLIVQTNQPDGKERICIPETALKPIVVWYHLTLMHPGETKLFDTIHLQFVHPKLRHVVKTITQNCELCQRYKHSTHKYGQLPPKQATEQPWETVAVDLIGPWNIIINNVNLGVLNAITMIDITTNITELIRLNNRDSRHAARAFENNWLSRYPSPTFCLHDNGGEFLGKPFQLLLQRHNIRNKTTTVKNPRANAICERMHLTIENMIRTSIHERPNEINQQHISQIIDDALASCMFALRAATHQTLKTTPSIIAFGRDMIFNIPQNINIQDIRNKRQLQININNERENKKRTNYQYEVGQHILIKIDDPTKLQARFQGPYQILQINNNGTIIIRKNDNTTQTINIRRIRPFFTSE